MYCSGCGTEVDFDLNYCKRCGSRVGRGESSVVAENLSGAVAYIGGFGMLGFVAVLFLMVKNSVAPGAMIPISFFYFAALFGICFMILRQTSPLAGRRRPDHGDSGASGAPAYLRPVTTAQLREPTDRPASVTEHTTRTLDEIPVLRK